MISVHTRGVNHISHFEFQQVKISTTKYRQEEQCISRGSGPPVHTLQHHSECLRCYTHSLQEKAEIWVLYSPKFIKTTETILRASLTGASIRRVRGEVPVQRLTPVAGRALHMAATLTLTLSEKRVKKNCLPELHLSSRLEYVYWITQSSHLWCCQKLCAVFSFFGGDVFALKTFRSSNKDKSSKLETVFKKWWLIIIKITFICFEAILKWKVLMRTSPADEDVKLTFGISYTWKTDKR